MNEIIPGLWLGSARSAANADKLKQHGVKAILNVALNIPNVLGNGDGFIAYHIPLLDGPGNDPEQVDIAVKQLGVLMRRGIPTLVHCKAGISRSSYIVARHLLATRHSTSLDAAVEFVAKARPRIFPNKALLDLPIN